ncbi:MAG: T9SS type A sorting domain-containing protein [Candidatus Marinimicrobia bacterium]|jgi:hypothetical protein|nr:T9SS type A sorting domain-containing protein [Candidatus Neomarinimicrobiota bacterium]MBT3678707.1 T9SS type A sorting domain-containing protein [Candidatus Neomarinimicrobiota bacterium]MBT3951645.1 T9SS type A sorting domain-containing protein [Candidatus Neomarinimicrobiota bacterium]MBT4253763.1 T9SS type A sorting domain-containing protein [Candidatus Neomarinimicrobiota bacterium]MBT4479903.1 T9SS type A sorting domain-containing protein [Candidatus Neomarinimicrobiota bacterium]
MRGLNKMVLWVLLSMGAMVANGQLRTTGYEIWLYNYSNSDLVFVDTTYEDVWDGQFYHLTTNDFRGGRFTVIANYTQSTENDSFGYVFDHLGYGGNLPVVEPWDTLSFGVYKISTVFQSTERKFYLDLRDDMGTPVDFYLRFGKEDTQNDTNWSWKGAEECIPYYSNNWTDIPNNDTLAIWALWDSCEADWVDGSPDLTEFQPANPSNLAYTKVSGSPRLSWDGTEELYDIETYDVYRGYQGGWDCIAHNLTVRYYLDDDVTFLPKNYLFQYKIRSVAGNGDTLSNGYSNVISIMGDGPISKDIAHGGSGLLPSEFEVNLYPNPFNPTTTIEYELPSESDIIIRIFDVGGRTVYNTLDEAKQAGYYQMKWNGTDSDGNQVKSGMYFTEIQAGEYRKVVKMLYLK